MARQNQLGYLIYTIIIIIIIIFIFYTLGTEDPEGFCTKIKQV